MTINFETVNEFVSHLEQYFKMMTDSSSPLDALPYETAHHYAARKTGISPYSVTCVTGGYKVGSRHFVSFDGHQFQAKRGGLV